MVRSAHALNMEPVNGTAQGLQLKVFLLLRLLRALPMLTLKICYLFSCKCALAGKKQYSHSFSEQCHNNRVAGTIDKLQLLVFNFPSLLSPQPVRLCTVRLLIVMSQHMYVRTLVNSIKSEGICIVQSFVIISVLEATQTGRKRRKKPCQHP